MSPSSRATTATASAPFPPMPMADFQFSFEPPVFPEPPAIPPSAELFSVSEASNILGFLENFNNWDFDGDPFNGVSEPNAQSLISDAFLGVYPDISSSSSNRPETNSSSLGADESARTHPYPRHQRRQSSPPRAQSPGSLTSASKASPSSASSNGLGPTRTKPLLSDPQKRMNHIMSEQKRRNAIRDGYAQLIALLAPAGAPPGSGMPTRGRPKGSGAKGKGRSGAGKSGVLLRAVEYCRWLEEGRDALLEEVRRVEAAASIRVDI